MSQSAFGVVVDLLTRKYVFTNQILRNRLNVANSPSDLRVFTNDSLIGVNLKDRPGLG